MAAKNAGYPTQQYEALVKQIKEAMAKKVTSSRRFLAEGRLHPGAGLFFVLLPFPGFLSRRRWVLPRSIPVVEGGPRVSGWNRTELVPGAGEPEAIP